jgi:hypothetical protein
VVVAISTRSLRAAAPLALIKTPYSPSTPIHKNDKVIVSLDNIGNTTSHVINVIDLFITYCVVYVSGPVICNITMAAGWDKMERTALEPVTRYALSTGVGFPLIYGDQRIL